MDFDLENKTLEISVREVAFSLKSTQSDGYISRRLRTRIGQEAHSIYQKKTNGQTEYYLKFTRSIKDWTVLIRGRVDVVHKNGNHVHLEEIKSTTRNIDLVEEDEAHILQLQIYCFYFYEFEGFSELSADLVIIDPVNNKKRRISINIDPVQELIDDFLRELIDYFLQENKQKEELKQRANSILFPYAEFRPFQKEIIDKLQEILPSKQRIMLHAPPGIGKTITTLYPTLRYSISTGQRLFIVTSKTTQQLIYIEAIHDLQQSGAQFKAIKITAKAKVCATDKYDCLDMDCPNLQNYIETDTRKIVSQLLQLDIIKKEEIESKAKALRICPFELSLDVAIGCDLVLSDFNYIFHPRVKFQRFQQEFGNSSLIIDEAHNLVSRATDYYSDVLSIKEIEKVIYFVSNTVVSSKIRNQLKQHLKRLIRNIQQLKDQIVNLEQEHSLVALDHNFYEFFQQKLDTLVIDYINALPVVPQKKDILVKFSDHLKFFTLLLRETREDEFEEIYDLDARQVRIYCKSAAKKLEEQMYLFENVIVQSATLQPIIYYQKMLGLSEDTFILNYSSPFPKENRLYFINPEIPTTFSKRYYYLEQLVNMITSICSLKQSNYLVFFPSFEYLKKAELIFKSKIINHRILKQHSNMSDERRQAVLDLLSQKKGFVLLAVMGGIFAEGVDYKGEMAQGAFIIGPGLPQINFDQELRKDYFDKTFGQGFDYAYRYPGISNVIQAAGRVFRQEDDQGFVIFIGYRFSTSEYLELLPVDYQSEIVKEAELIKKVQAFWNTRG